ncbi:heme biosynthesis protein HemY [Falsihalocynthiibacter sp. SS001]|uniref:heme biosynthesis protein HemY n=1 Tax=Falsihalocynthiibacter sp. SS001 TaxID=3349698 RepID=UPI0036D33542
MIWSLVKILSFVVLIAAVALGAGMLAESGEGIRIAFAQTEFTLQPLQAAIAVVVLVLVVWVAIKILGLIMAVIHFLSGDETALSRYFDRNRERKGYEAMAQGMMAVSSGEGRVALAKAAKAEKYLNRPELTNLLTAQAAEISGDAKKAQEVYKRLLADDRTRFVGIRGIMKQKLIEGDTDTALALAERAFALKPRHAEVQNTLLQLQTEKQDWSGARRTLKSQVKHGAIPRDVYKRRDAVLALSEVSVLLDEDSTIEAREAAIAAQKQSPDLIPATVLAADVYIDQGKPKLAARIIKKAWDAQPHPDLAAAFARIAPDEDAQARLARFGALTSLRQDHPETIMLHSELLIANEDFPEARRKMGTLAETHPTSRSLALMAAIERGEGADDTAVRAWLAKALTAPRSEQWVCDSCGQIHGVWVPVCDNCHSIDTLSWKMPAEPENASTQAASMLSLIVDKKPTKSSREPLDPEALDPLEVVVQDAEIVEEPSKS